MTVKELIEQLQQLDPDLGKHEDADSSYFVPDKTKYTIVKSIIL